MATDRGFGPIVSPLRCWRTEDGLYLVETARSHDWAATGQRFIAPDGKRVERSSAYYLFDASGSLKETYEPSVSSSQEVMSYYGHYATDSKLHELTCAWTDSQYSAEPPDMRDEVVLSGLSPLAPQDVRDLPFASDPESARRASEEARRKETQAALAAEEASRLRRPGQLPEVPGRASFHARLVEESSQIVLKADDQELWRESAFNSGIERPREIEAILRQRYGGRVRSFRSTVDYGE